MEATNTPKNLYESPRDNQDAWDKEMAFERPITYQHLLEREKYLTDISHTD